MDDISLKQLKEDVEKAAKELLKEELLKVVLYGSYARGDYDNESDIDFALISSMPNETIPAYNKNRMQSPVYCRHNQNLRLFLMHSRGN